MAGVVTFETVTFIIAMGGVAFGIYHFFRNPDIKNREDIIGLQAALRGYKELNQKIQQLGDNHLHAIETKVDVLGENIATLREKISSLGAIIEERIPKKS